MGNRQRSHVLEATRGIVSFKGYSVFQADGAESGVTLNYFVIDDATAFAFTDAGALITDIDIRDSLPV